MKKILVFIALVLIRVQNGFSADYNINSVGNNDFVTGSDGYSGTGQKVGNQYFYNDNQGNNSTSQKIGDMTFTNGTLSSQKVGNMTFSNDNDGNSYTTQKIGNSDYTNGSNGYSGSGTRNGNFYNYNDND